MTRFDHPRPWIFDLDNTLYPPEARLFDQIESRMTAWVAEALGMDRSAADLLRLDYWERYGTTLSGLMAEHGLDPAPYLDAVHDISFDGLDPDPELAAAIVALPGRKIVFTNGSAPYARNVLAARGLTEVFDAIYGIEHADFRPKPERAAFEAILARDGAAAATAAMFEDVSRNLEAPFAMGMTTVLVTPSPEPAPHVHHHTANLPIFLAQLG